MSRHKGHPTSHRATHPDPVFRVLFVAVMITLMSGVMLVVKADASTPWVQPYGGCAEAWQAPASAGADQCRDHGWTVRARLVLDSRHRVRASRLPHCRQEDGSGQRSACSWNFHDGTVDGNGYGMAYWVDRANRFHTVWSRHPARLDLGWHWTTRHEQAQHIPAYCIARDDTTVESGLVAVCRPN